MSALAHQFKKIGVSFINNTITWYYDESDKSIDQQIRKATHNFFNMQNYIHRDYEYYDHDTYHQDLFFNRETTHTHIQPGSIFLTEKEITKVLDIFVQSELIDDKEKEEFLEKFRQRYIEKRTELDNLINGINDKHLVAEKIIGFISDCKDNDVLSNLHTYLLNKKFDYLREFKSLTCWQGTNSNKEITSTSASWAAIEKAIALQMAKNVSDNLKIIPKYQKHYEKHIDYMSKALPYFSIKRKKGLISFFKDSKAKFYNYLSSITPENAQEKKENLNKSHEKHFKKYK